LINNFATIAPNIGPVINQTHENLDSDGGYLSLDNLRLPDASIHAIETIARAASNHGSKAYLVGGMVRDIIARLPKIATSPDVTIIGDAIKFAEALVLENADCSLISASQLHTVKVKIGSVTIDIASARTDLYEPWGSLPQITLVNDIESDLQRRDFTVNAMAIRLTPSGLGDFIDPFSGCADVTNGTLRTIHDDSFREDPLRMLRGARLAARYGYSFETHTSDLLQQSLDNLHLITETSPQRVFNEFRLWFQPYENLEAVAKIATETGLLSAIGIRVYIPDFYLSFGRLLAHASELQRFAAFAYEVPEELLDSLVNRLKMPSKWQAVASDAANMRRVAHLCIRQFVSDRQLYRWLIDIDNRVLQTIIQIERKPAARKPLERFENRLRHIRTALNGDDLIALGVPRGPMIGQMLEELLARRIYGYISTAEQEREYVAAMLRLNDG